MKCSGRDHFFTAKTAALGAALCLAVSAAVWARPRPQEATTTQATTAQTKAPASKPRAVAKASETPPSPPGMTYHTTLDRTAVWVGDQFHYLITVDYASQYEFVLDNLNKENVNMDPFPVVDVEKTVTPFSDNRNRLLVDITLANFSLTPTDARIPQISLYYFRRDQHTGAEQAAAESLNVVGPMIGLRSTLPANPSDLRDTVTVAGWQTSRWIVPAVGDTALVALLAWLGWEAYLFVKKRRTQQGPDRRESMEMVRSRWARGGVPSDFSDTQATKAFLDRSYQNVKEYIGYYLDAETLSLTAEEVKDEMQRRGESNDLTQKVTRVLSVCEAARYSANGTATSAESARSVAQEARELLSLAPKD